MLLALQNNMLLVPGIDPPDDESPDPFAFTNVTGAALNQQRTSNTITVSGLGSGISVDVTVTGAQYSKNGGGYTSAAGTAQNGDTFALRRNSSGAYSTTVSGTLTIGDQSDTWTVRTMSDPSSSGDSDFIEPAEFSGFIQ